MYCTYLVSLTLLLVDMHISNAGPHQPTAASFFNLQHQIKYVCMYVCRNTFGDQGNMERNFWEQGNSVKVNFGELLNLFLRNKGTTVNFHREQGNMHPPWEALIAACRLTVVMQMHLQIILLPVGTTDFEWLVYQKF